MFMKKENPQHFPRSQPFCVPIGEDVLNVEVTLPGNEAGIVAFNEEDLDNRDLCSESIATVLNKHNLATLLPDMPAFVDLHLDAPKAADRLERLILWAGQQPEITHLALGCLA